VDVITTPFGLSDEQTTRVLTAACRAPSLHNSQPWSFRVTHDRIELSVDPARRLPAGDPGGREARLACGAALMNLRLALAKVGVKARVSIEADSAGEPVATIENGGEIVMTPARAELERAIAHRRTNRLPFFESDVPAGHRQLLARAAATEGATLRFVDDQAELTRIRELVGQAHRRQHSDPAWAAEWASWTGRQNSPDGVPITSAGPVPAPQDWWKPRDFGPPGRPNRQPDREFDEQPLLAVLGTHSDLRVSQLQAGEAMERVLLTATNLGLAVSYLSQLIEVDEARTELGILIGGRLYPQAVLRIGFGGPVPATPRRPVEDCLIGQPAGLV